MRTAPAVPCAVRPYRPEDEGQVLDLLRASLGGGPAGTRPVEFFRWKHLENPFGPSFLLVAETPEGRIAALRAFMRWRFVAGDRVVPAVRAVDTATHPDFQRMGLFSRLTREALEALREEADLVFNTPNDRSLPGYLKMGWQVVAPVPVLVRVRRPVRFARLAWSRSEGPEQARATTSGGTPALQALDAADDVEDLLARAGEPGPALRTDRSLPYLRWRYGSAPLLGYRAIRLERGDRLDGLALVRVRPRGALVETAVAEAIVPAGDRAAAAALLRLAVRSADVDHVTCHFPPRSAADVAARRVGFLPSPVRPTLVVNPLRAASGPDPRALGSWALSLGDLEVF